MENQPTTRPHSESVATAQTPILPKSNTANKKLLTVAILLGAGLVGTVGYIVFDIIRDGNREETAYDRQPQASQEESKDDALQPSETNCPDNTATEPSNTVALSNEYFYFVDYGVKIKKPKDVSISYLDHGGGFNYSTNSPNLDRSGIYFSCIGSKGSACFDTMSKETGLDTAFADPKHQVILGTMAKGDYEKELEAHQSYPGDKLLEVNGNVILLSTINLDQDVKWQARIDFLSNYIKDNISTI